jgi:hypothetical protein
LDFVLVFTFSCLFCVNCLIYCFNLTSRYPCDDSRGHAAAAALHEGNWSLW